MSSIKNLKPVNLTDTEQAYTGFVYVSKNVFKQICGTSHPKNQIYVSLKQFIFALGFSEKFQDETIGIGKITRQYLRVSFTDNVDIKQYVFDQEKEKNLSVVKIEVELLQSMQSKLEIEDTEIITKIKENLKNTPLQPNHIFLLDYNGNTLSIKINYTELMDLGVKSTKEQSINQPGFCSVETDFEVSGKNTPTFKIKNSTKQAQSLFRSDFQFNSMGIGGLDKELMDIFRRAFASRRFPPSVLQKYGITHVKGVLLYGPPGTGKTLIARQLSKTLKSKEPKIVNGPSIMSKFVGESEQNIRDLFKEAIQDQSELGEDSELHIIIFDEIDAICKQRGSVSSGTGVHDSMVNQLLSMIDGVDALNNILVIGMTNRKDLIDEAILRPGRFEVHIEISLPDQNGRQDIFKIHTKNMQQNNLIGTDITLEHLSKITKNFTGAEIEALVKSAASFSFNRGANLMDFNSPLKLDQNVKVELQDFQQALKEIKPQFGADTEKFEILTRNGIIDYGAPHKRIQNLLQSSIDQVRNGKSSQMHSILLEGQDGSGKTAYAAWTALNCQFPYVKLISPEQFVGYSETSKINAIVKIFDDAYKSPQSCIILDNIERIIEFVDLGPRFSNPLLQTLLVLIKRIPTKENNRLLIVGTTSFSTMLKELELVQSFNLTIKVDLIQKKEHFDAIFEKFNVKLFLKRKVDKKIVEKITNEIQEISIKKLLLVIDMATHDNRPLDFDEFMECYDAIQSKY